MAAKDRVVRDPLYGYVVLPAKLAPIVDSPMYQRLRRVAQTSLTSAVYPSLTGSRFEHGLGAMHLAGLAWDGAWRNSRPETQNVFLRDLEKQVPELPYGDRDAAVGEIRSAVMAVGLLHDLGHPPFSHALEPLYKENAGRLLRDDAALATLTTKTSGPFHEFAGEWILEHHLAPLLGAEPAFGSALLQIFRAEPSGTSPVSALHSIVAGELDIDRLDYLIRDGQKAGTEFGAIDWERFLSNLQLRQFEDGYRIAPNVSARSAVETIMVQRTQAYRWIIFHHRVVASNLALSSAVECLLDLAENQEAVEVHGAVVTPGQVFSALIGNFDFLAPGAEALDAVGHPIVTGGDSPGSSRPSELFRDALPKLGASLSAGVDDSRINRTLLDGRVLAEGLLHEGSVDIALRERLTQFLSYSEASMFRKKNVLPVWKTESHFSDIAFDLGDLLRPVVVQSVENLSDVKWKEALRKKLRTEVGDLDSALSYEESAALFNWVMTLILGHASQRRAFEKELDDSWPGEQEGYWRCAPTNFAALAHGHKAGIVWDEQGEPMKLTRASALIAGLEKVERQRNQYAFFFFLEFPNSMAGWDATTVRGMRYLLTDHLKRQFPSFAERELPENLVAKRQ